MEIFLIKLLQFILAISLLVLLHEGGHMFFSKLFGIRVEKFFIFFDVGIGKWSGKLFSFKLKGDTEYGMGWLPLGGYCKISGMIDESFDTEQMKQAPQPWEFRTHPAWQRLLVMIGGVLVNFLLALFIYSMIMYHWGESYVRMDKMSYGMKFSDEAKKLGFRDHDKLLGTDLGEFKDFNVDVYRDLSEAHTAYVERQGKTVSVPLPGNLNLLDMLKKTPQFARPFIPAKVDTVLETMPAMEDSKTMITSPAYKIGLKKGDMILAVNGVPVDSYNEFTDQMGVLSDELAAAKTHADSVRICTVTIAVMRAGAPSGARTSAQAASVKAAAQDTASLTTPTTAPVDTLKAVLTPDLKFGFAVASVPALYEKETTHVSYGFLQSFPAGVKYGWDVLAGYVSDMKYVFTADGAKSLGGFGAIGSLFPSQWDWYLFWKMTAFLSIILAFMNILPIPALDGGHVVFLLYEIITGRKPGEKFMIRAEYVGFAILILLMIIANLNDVLRWLGVM